MAPWFFVLHSSILMVQFHFIFGYCLALSPRLLLALLRACVCSFCGCLFVSPSIVFLFVALSLSFDLSNFSRCAHLFFGLLRLISVSSFFFCFSLSLFLRTLSDQVVPWCTQANGVKLPPSQSTSKVSRTPAFAGLACILPKS